MVTFTCDRHLIQFKQVGKPSVCFERIDSTQVVAGLGSDIGSKHKRIGD